MIYRKELHALLRQDMYSFISKAFGTVVPGAQFFGNWHLQAIAYHLELVEQDCINRLIITLPPRSLKSISASVAFPAWLLGRDPTRRIVCVSYADALAGKHASDMRRLMQSEWYQEVFPGTRIDPKKSRLQDMTTTDGGYRLSTSVGGSLTGRGGDIIILDDPHKAHEVESDVSRESVIDWYKNTLLSRLNHPEDPIILIMQRLHEEDLAGHLLATGEWDHLNLPAVAEEEEWIEVGWDEDDWYVRQEGELLHPERVSQKNLDELKSELGPYVYEAQYQQRPAPLGGGIIKWDWFEFYDRVPHRQPDDQVVQCWDPAMSITEHADYSVCTTWLLRGDRFYLIDVVRVQLEHPQLVSRILLEARRHKPNLILMETLGHGKALFDDVRRHVGIRMMGTRPEGDKVSRMVGESSAIYAGYVYLPKEAPWLMDLRREIVAFPKGKHDDQVDSISLFLYWTRLRGPRRRNLQVRVTPVYAEPNYTTADILNSPYQ